MNKISNKTIRIYKGESLNFAYRPNDYTLLDGDTVTLTIKRRLKDNKPVIQKVITNVYGNTIQVDIPAKEMEKLPVGGYCYNMIVENDYIKWVLIPPSKLIIREV